MRRKVSERALAMPVRRSRKAITAAASIVLFLMPIAARAHSFPVAVDVVNPPSEDADSKNAKLTFLTSRARQAAVQAGSIEAAQSIYYKKYLWHQTHLTICFWNGSEKAQREVMKAAATWTAAVPILQFDFEVNGKIRTCDLQDLQSFARMSDIRINLDANDPRQLWSPDDIRSKAGDWAYPGPSVAQNPKYPTTMNLADVVGYRRDSKMTDYFFTIRHVML